MQTLGQKIKAIRLERGETMSEFSTHFENAMSGTVSNWETDRNKPNKARLKKIAELGNMTVEELLEEKHYMGNITTPKEAVGFVRIKLLNIMNEIEFIGLSHEWNPKTGEKRIVIDYKEKMKEIKNIISEVN